MFVRRVNRDEIEYHAEMAAMALSHQHVEFLQRAVRLVDIPVARDVVAEVRLR